MGIHSLFIHSFEYFYSFYLQEEMLNVANNVEQYIEQFSSKKTHHHHHHQQELLYF